MGAFVGMWVAGAGLEMMRRGVLLTVWQLVLAMGAWSLGLAFVWNLTREWFDFDGRLLGARVAGTLMLLSIVGWWLGDLAGARNPLFALNERGGNENLNENLADGWALSLAGAQLLGVAACVATHRGHPLRVLNPRGATWWLLVFAAGLVSVDESRAAAVALAAFGPFLIWSWNTRALLPIRALKLAWTIVAIGVGISIWFCAPESPMELWREAAANGMFALLCLWAIWLATRGPNAWKRFVDESPTRGALLKSTLLGALVATYLFGPKGALWWSFWPLAGLFFDALRPFSYESENPFVDETRTDSAFVDETNGRAVGVSAGGGRAQKR